MNQQKEIKNIIDKFYGVLSGKKHQERDWELFKTLFAQGARLRPLKHVNNDICVEAFSVEDYIKRLKSFLAENDFYEYGENYKIEIFNNIAHAYTEYTAKKDINAKSDLKKGINLIQFVKDEQRWFISCMQWEDVSIK